MYTYKGMAHRITLMQHGYPSQSPVLLIKTMWMENLHSISYYTGPISTIGITFILAFHACE